MTERDVSLLNLTSAAFVGALQRALNEGSDRAAAATQLGRIERDLVHLMESAELSGPAVQQIRSLAILRASLSCAVRQLQPQRG